MALLRLGRRGKHGDQPEQHERGSGPPHGTHPTHAASKRMPPAQPPATAGRIVTSSPAETCVSRPSWKRMSSPET